MPETMPTRVVIDARPWWKFLDGTLLPVVSGGDGGGGGGEGNAGGEGGDPPDLGDAGKRAIAAERDARTKAEKARKAAETKAADLEARLAELDGAQKSEHQKALEKARKEAGEAAGKEATAKANARIVRAEVRAAAGGKLADPNDAVRLLDLDEFAVDDDGEVDAKAIEAAIAKLVKDKPYLASGASRPSGDADQGARGGNGSAEVSPGYGRLRHAYETTAKK